MQERVEKPRRMQVPHMVEKVVVRVMVVGFNSVGKTALVARMAEQAVAQRPSTLGVDYFDRHINLSNIAYHLNFFDFSGRDLYMEIRNEFYRDSNVLLLVYDVAYKRTFDELEEWIKEAQEYEFVGLKVLVGNKIDEGRVVSEETVRAWAKDKGCLCADVSAKDGRGVKELTELIIKAVK